MGDKVNALNAQSGETGKGDAAPCVAHTVAPQAIGFEPRYYTRDNKTGGGPSSTVSITAGGASKFGDAAPCVAHVVAPPLTATNDPSRSPQSAEVTAQVEAVLRAQYPEVIGSLDTECGGGKLTHQSAKNGHLLPVVPYDLFQITAPINRQSRDEHSPCHTLARDNEAHAAVVTTQATHFDVYNHKTTGDIAGVVREQHGTNMNAVLQPSMAVRRLTPTECERLQGFPDGWTQIPWKGKPASDCPDGPRYRALGNSMAVPVIRWIGRKIEERMEEAYKGGSAC
jgi:DNA (cytosine-5)-methyltransferase 1